MSLFILLSLCTVVSSADFKYDRCSDHGPTQWPDTCSAQAQKTGSPIDLCGATPLPYVPSFVVNGYDKARMMTVLDNGHTIQLGGASPDPPTLQLGNISAIVGRSQESKDYTWTFEQIHLHWGRTGKVDEGSEHYMQGKNYPLEAHLVHFNREVGDNVSHALSTGRADALLVIGVMFAIGADNEQIHIVDYYVQNATKASKRMNTPVTLSELFTPGDFYAYAGSLTTPPCAEAVTWVVLKTPKTLALSTLDRLKEASATPSSDKFRSLSTQAAPAPLDAVERISKYGNYRPLQIRSNRPLFISSGSSAACGTVTEPYFDCSEPKGNAGKTQPNAALQASLNYFVLVGAAFFGVSILFGSSVI